MCALRAHISKIHIKKIDIVVIYVAFVRLSVIAVRLHSQAC